MSYNFTVTKTEDGLTVACSEGMLSHIPDGTYLVSGHVNADSSNESVGINRRGVTGNVEASAQSWHR